MIRRIRGVIADVLCCIVRPFGYDVNVLATCGLPGVDRIFIVRRGAGLGQVRRIGRRQIDIGAPLQGWGGD